MIAELLKMFGMFGGIFGGLWLAKRLIRMFLPAIKMWGERKPWQ